jgi:stress-induced morphogen
MSKDDQTMEDRIREKLQGEFAPVHLELVNESDQHSVPRGSETHFKLILVSTQFEGLRTVQRQRLVYEVLKAELKGGVHALAQRTLTPAEWESLGATIKADSPPCLGGSSKRRNAP